MVIIPKIVEFYEFSKNSGLNFSFWDSRQKKKTLKNKKNQRKKLQNKDFKDFFSESRGFSWSLSPKSQNFMNFQRISFLGFWTSKKKIDRKKLHIGNTTCLHTNLKKKKNISTFKKTNTQNTTFNVFWGKKTMNKDLKDFFQKLEDFQGHYFQNRRISRIFEEFDRFSGLWD